MTTTPTILTSHSGADFLAMLPTLAGFTPRESLLVVPFHGRRTMGVLRIDLPSAVERDDHDRLGSVTLGAMARLTRCDGVVLVVYTDDPFTVGFAKWRRFVGRLAARFASAGFTVKDELCTAADGWASWRERDVPVSGHPPRDIDDSPLATQAAALRGGARLPVAGVDEPLPPVEPVVRRRVSRAVREVVHGGETAALGRPTSAVPHRAGEAIEKMLRCQDATDMTESLVVQVAAAMLHGADRNAAMIRIAFGRAAARRVRAGRRRHRRHASRSLPADAAGAWAVGADGSGPAEAAAWILGVSTQSPDTRVMDHAIPQLRHVAAHLEPQLRPDILCMLAWLYWALGSGSRAGHCVDEALRIAPGHELAGILHAVIGSGALPEWVYTQHDAAVTGVRRAT